MPQLTRITRDPAVMCGQPCIRGMRVTVGTVVSLDCCMKVCGHALNSGACHCSS